jgi:small nuclear ribonucleoprotein (snRNP)-like protein
MLGYRPLALRRRVLVNLDTGRAFRGVLIKSDRTLLQLANAELIEPGSDPVAVSGTVIVERARVEFVQVVN